MAYVTSMLPTKYRIARWIDNHLGKAALLLGLFACTVALLLWGGMAAVGVIAAQQVRASLALEFTVGLIWFVCWRTITNSWHKQVVIHYVCNVLMSAITAVMIANWTIVLTRMSKEISAQAGLALGVGLGLLIIVIWAGIWYDNQKDDQL